MRYEILDMRLNYYEAPSLITKDDELLISHISHLISQPSHLTSNISNLA
jgi:hypothetical protein